MRSFSTFFVCFFILVALAAAQAGEACIDDSQCSIAGERCSGGQCSNPNIGQTNPNEGSSAPPSVFYGAIAYSKSTGWYSPSPLCYSTQSAAKVAAESHCRQTAHKAFPKIKDCHWVIATGANGAAAFAFDPKAPNDQFGLGWGSSLAKAKALALKDCKSPGCKVGTEIACEQ